MLDALEASPARRPGGARPPRARRRRPARAILRHAADAGRAAARSGAHTQAAAFFAHRARAAARRWPRPSEAELLELLAEECYLIDRLDDAIAASERAMRAAGAAPATPPGVSANHHALSVYHWYNADRRRRRAPRRRRRRGARRPTRRGGRRRPRPLGHALAMQAYLALQAQRPRPRPAPGRRARPSVAAERRRPDAVGAGRLIDGICDGGRAATPSGREAMLAILAVADEHFDEIYSSGYSNLTYLDVEQRRLRRGRPSCSASACR